METELSAWLQGQIKERRVNARQVAVHAGVGVATVSDILHRGHIPRIETLVRLADYFDAPREALLRIAAGLPAKPAAGRPGPPAQDEEYLIEELVEAFRQVPDEWKEDALAQMEMWARYAKRQGIRIIGGEDEEQDGQERP